MYIEADKKSYWLVDPTLKEQNDVVMMPVREKRELWYGVWFVGVPVLIMFLSVGVLARTYGNTPAPGWTVLVPATFLLVPIVAFAIAMIRGNYSSTLRRMQKEHRAFELTHSYWIYGSNRADTLLHGILLGGERYLDSMEYRFQVIRQLRPELVNPLLADPVLVDALDKYSKASTERGREAWRTVIEPHISTLIADTHSLISRLLADEQQDTALSSAAAEVNIQQDLHEVERFTRDKAWAS
jgi:hypothetical protein